MSKVPPQDARPFPAAEFAELVLLGIAAGEAEGTAARGFDRRADDGSVSLVDLPESPYTRAAFAFRARFADDRVGFSSAFMRFRALMDLYSRGALGEWVQPRGGQRMAIHPAVIDVASSMRLSKNGKLPPRKFAQAVASVARRDYAQLQEWS